MTTTYLALPANDEVPWYEWGTQKVRSLLKAGDEPPQQTKPGDIVMGTEGEGEGQGGEGGEQGGEGEGEGQRGEGEQQDDPTERLLEAARERERLAQEARRQSPALVNTDGTPVTEIGGVPVVAAGETSDTDSEDDVASDGDENADDEPTAMDIGTALASPMLMTANTRATITKIAKMKADLAMMKSKSQLTPMSHNLRTSPMLNTVSRANSTPRLVDNITFRNAFGAKLYSDARSQLEPYATVTFADALASGTVTTHQLVYSSMMLASSMRQGVKFTDSLYNYTPGKQTARSRTVSVAASQLGQSLQHAVIPATEMFMQSGGLFAKLRNFFKGKPKTTKTVKPAVTQGESTTGEPVDTEDEEPDTKETIAELVDRKSVV